ncbi:CoA-binding protein [Flavobacteriaceae bacterium]|jgi:predicted CoA-binding protein|nr:CoA-binding protein [Flavobacteriaceae bacterium]MDB4255867.1 CoA-binding protein [Flavobacteriaceae bacterium]
MVEFKTLVIGASINPERYAYKAIQLLVKNEIEVVPMGVKPGFVANLLIVSPLIVQVNIHTITLYLGASKQEPYYDFILKINPKRVLFNPGTENPKLAKLLNGKGILWENACTLVLLSTNQYKT